MKNTQSDIALKVGEKINKPQESYTSQEVKELIKQAMLQGIIIGAEEIEVRGSIHEVKDVLGTVSFENRFKEFLELHHVK